MPRPTANIQAEIALLEGQLATPGSGGNVGGLIAAMSSGQTAMTAATRKDLTERLDLLYRQLDRLLNGSQFARGRLVGLAGGSQSATSP